jgi:hypothetical protein
MNLANNSNVKSFGSTKQVAWALLFIAAILLFWIIMIFMNHKLKTPVNTKGKTASTQSNTY